ncbi:uracil-DNA glycosylase [Aliiruegeria haliotis]|uniref:Uracil-DNA glycosylase n=1 Tax=Aliiruegeria haliotis TaxID=1280846 RepID=A0A2T0RZI3_9RHOB|nr:uracil-DNA glycosylase [Aliiruegeria haliotis]PRY26587.1 uracil-DNA glycosylase [Aliiruegeria haliotis]
MTLSVRHIGAWGDLPFFAQDLPRIAAALDAEERDVLPAERDVFAALELTQPDQTRVVILGQDPYPTPGHAHGLAFSAEADVRPLPRSLGNIYKEMEADLGAAPPNADLRFWARQGVLLLNAVLTVPAGEAHGHKSLGWQALTRQVIARLSSIPRAFLLWGKPAQATAAGALTGTDHFILETAHPSPLSARKGFFGSRPFSRTNSWLQAQGHSPINWTSPEAA